MREYPRRDPLRREGWLRQALPREYKQLKCKKERESDGMLVIEHISIAVGANKKQFNEQVG